MVNDRKGEKEAKTSDSHPKIAIFFHEQKPHRREYKSMYLPHCILLFFCNGL